MEMIRDGENGLLSDFFDVDAMAEKAVRVLKDPAASRHLGRNAERMVQEKYSMEVVLPQMLRMYEDATAGRP
jgi:glycosyltransferase involved in cell wall biosynthesis